MNPGILAAELRGAAPVPTIVVIANDDPDGEGGQDEWAGAILQALAPEASWVLVDATRKPSDTRAALRAIGTPDALVVPERRVRPARPRCGNSAHPSRCSTAGQRLPAPGLYSCWTSSRTWPG
jgi:hypothetical protein